MRRKFMVFMVLTSMLLTAGLTGGCVGFVRSEQRAEITGTDKTKSLAEAEITAHIPENVSAKNAAADPSANNSEGFVLVAEAVPDVIQEIRYYSTYNFVGERIDGYEEPCALLTREAAEALRKVSDAMMAQGYRLKIYDAYRPRQAVDHFVRWAADTGDTRMKPYFYPEVDKSLLFIEGYIGTKSGHSRGSTVDLTLLDMQTGKELDMGGTFDYFGERSHPDYNGDLTQEQKTNRRILREAMLKEGFRALDTEWWHFTLNNEPYPNTYFTFPVCGDLH